MLFMPIVRGGERIERFSNTKRDFKRIGTIQIKEILVPFVLFFSSRTNLQICYAQCPICSILGVTHSNSEEDMGPMQNGASYIKNQTSK